MRAPHWLEVWIDSGSHTDFVYILIVRALNSSFHIVDPQKHGEVVETFDEYDEAVHWLNEEEYALVEGRYVLEA